MGLDARESAHLRDDGGNEEGKRGEGDVAVRFELSVKTIWYLRRGREDFAYHPK